MKMKACAMFLLNMLMKTKMNLFYKHEYKNKSNFFSNHKLKFQPRTWNYSVNIEVNSSVLFNENCSVQCKCEYELFCILNG